MKKIIRTLFIIILIITGIYLYNNSTITNKIINMANKYTNDLKDFISSGKLISDKDLNSLKDSNIDYSTYSVNIETSPYYSMLDENEKDLYKQIYANADNLKKTFVPKQNITKNELEETIIAVYNDSPELFWIDTSYSYKYLISGKIAQVTLNYNSTADDIESSKYLFNQATNKIINEANNYNNNYDKEKFVHDYILEKNIYDINNKLNQSAYSALVNGKTVCAGYSRAFQYIMNKLNITTYYVTGKSQGESHAWNIVKLGNGYYNIDLTWDDGKIITYNYFNKTDYEFSKTHERSEKSINLPSCNATTYKYKKPTTYKYKKPYINNSTNNYDKEYIKNHTKKKSTQVIINNDDDEDDNNSKNYNNLDKENNIKNQNNESTENNILNNNENIDGNVNENNENIKNQSNEKAATSYEVVNEK